MTRRVLVVDDEPYVTHVLKQFLSRAGLVVRVANNGEQALDGFEDFNPSVVITDIQMPKIAGQQLCRLMAERYPDEHRLVMVITSRTDRELRDWAQSLGGIEFMEKPASPRRVVERVCRHMETLEPERAVS